MTRLGRRENASRKIIGSIRSTGCGFGNIGADVRPDITGSTGYDESTGQLGRVDRLCLMDRTDWADSTGSTGLEWKCVRK